jgi:hypothetical protein
LPYYEGVLMISTFIFQISPNFIKYTYGWLPLEQHHKIEEKPLSTCLLLQFVVPTSKWYYCNKSSLTKISLVSNTFCLIKLSSHTISLKNVPPWCKVSSKAFSVNPKITFEHYFSMQTSNQVPMSPMTNLCELQQVLTFTTSQFMACDLHRSGSW